MLRDSLGGLSRLACQKGCSANFPCTRSPRLEPWLSGYSVPGMIGQVYECLFPSPLRFPVIVAARHLSLWPHLPRLLPLPTHLLHVPYLLKVFLVSIFIQTTLFLFRLLRQLRQVPQAIPTTLTMRGVSRVLLGNDNFRQCALRSGAPIIGLVAIIHQSV